MIGGVATRRSTFGTTLKGHFVLNDVNCTGNESNIFDCQHPTDVHINCQVARNEEAGAVCGVTSGNN
jgi:predicted nucleic-acid-binding Zn-ribbon protein